jgi:hypothetical protein
MKIAWDEFKLADLSKYVIVWKKLMSPYFYGTQDYMMVQAILVEAIKGRWKDELIDR